MKKWLKFVIPSLITLVILLIIFFVQGLYPFSDNSIVQVDADYQFIPVLYRIYDFLHGNANIIYDDIGLGNNIYISMIIQGSIFSPLSLLLYFTSRSNIINYYNIIIIIKLCLISLTIYIYINKTFKISEFYKITFSILYTFSGWIILNYFNVMWLDSIILFPLIIFFLDKLLKNGKYLGYIITLSLSLIISYYISYFILTFILFYSFVYIFLKIDKKRIKEIIFRLGLSTIIAILISSFSLLPALYQTIISSRFNVSGGNILFYNVVNKSLYLIFSSVFLVLFFKLIPKYKRDKKNIYFYFILLILFSIGLFIEPINLALHMGSYWSFPYRYSFITLFILMCGSLYYLEKYGGVGISRYNFLRILILILLGLIVIFLNNLFNYDIVNSQIILDFSDIDIYIKILMIVSIILVMISISLSFRNVKLRYILFSIVCCLQIFVYSSWTMYYDDGYFLSRNSNLINDNIDFVKDSIDRYKMGYINYTPDYGFIYDVNTLDNWLHILPSNEVEIYDRLGYKTSDTCIRSYGGTIFSDWLLNFRYLIDTEENNDDIYQLLDSYDEYYLYKYNYNNGFGILYNNVINNNINYDSLSGFDLHNTIYRDILNSDNDIIDIDYYNYEDISDQVTFKYDIDNKGFLYIDLFNDIDYIKVNENYISYDDIDYIIDLGIYEDDVTIEIGVINGINYIDFSLGFIKYNDIMNLTNNVNDIYRVNNGYNINIFNDLYNGYLFLPINNISGLKIYVNDKRVEVDNYINNFVNIKLDKGDNKVEVRYEMPVFKVGMILSIIGILFLLFVGKIFMNVNSLILNITYYIYIIACLLFYLYFYLFSFLKYYNY